MTSMAPTIEAKSDQLNAEDLLAGPRTVTITGVQVRTSDDQPVWVSFEGDNEKPFKPCKTMRRLLVRVWGDDSSEYAGRSMTLYFDPEVKYGGMKVGGARISHMSHMDGPKSFFLTETRGRKKQHTVKPLNTPAPKRGNVPDPEELSLGLEALREAETMDDLQKVWIDYPSLRSNRKFQDLKDERKTAISQEGTF